MNSKRFNIFTGSVGMAVWVFLTYHNPEHSTNIAIGSLLCLIGFGGVNTIKEILETWKGQQ